MKVRRNILIAFSAGFINETNEKKKQIIFGMTMAGVCWIYIYLW